MISRKWELKSIIILSVTSFIVSLHYVGAFGSNVSNTFGQQWEFKIIIILSVTAIIATLHYMWRLYKNV